jgi:hypothetical protein
MRSFCEMAPASVRCVQRSTCSGHSHFHALPCRARSGSALLLMPRRAMIDRVKDIATRLARVFPSTTCGTQGPLLLAVTRRPPRQWLDRRRIGHVRPILPADRHRDGRRGNATSLGGFLDPSVRHALRCGDQTPQCDVLDENLHLRMKLGAARKRRTTLLFQLIDSVSES